MLFTAEVIGHLTNARILPLSHLSTSTLALYAIYAGSHLRKIVAVNFEFYDPSTATARSGMTIDLSAVFGTAKLRVKRLTGPSSATLTGVTLMGESFETGKATGGREMEFVNGSVVVLATEAVIVEVT